MITHADDPPKLADVFDLPFTNGQEERQARKQALAEAINGADALETLKLGLKALEDIDSPTKRFVALQHLRAQTELTNGKAFDQAIATLIDKQRNDKDCTRAELMERQHYATWGIDQFGCKGALVGIGGDKGEGKTTLMYRTAIAVESGDQLFDELTVQKALAIIVQCNE